jgi:hypothetical protein
MDRRTFVAASAAAAAAASLPATARAAPHVLPGDDTFVRETWRELDGRTCGSTRRSR